MFPGRANRTDPGGVPSFSQGMQVNRDLGLFGILFFVKSLDGIYVEPGFREFPRNEFKCLTAGAPHLDIIRRDLTDSHRICPDLSDLRRHAS